MEKFCFFFFNLHKLLIRLLVTPPQEPFIPLETKKLLFRFFIHFIYKQMNQTLIEAASVLATRYSGDKWLKLSNIHNGEVPSIILRISLHMSFARYSKSEWRRANSMQEAELILEVGAAAFAMQPPVGNNT